MIPIHDQATRFAGKHGDKQDGKGNGLGVGQPGDPCPTLTKGDHHAVAMPVTYDHKDLGRRNAAFEDASPTLRARMGTGGDNVPLVMAHGQANAVVMEGICPAPNCNHEQPIVAGTITAYNMDSRSPQSSEQTRQVEAVLRATGYAVRRLTPLECERLQGFPDGWTDIEWEVREYQPKRKGKLGKLVDAILPLKKIRIERASDSARYKALGNSVAIPCVEYVAEGIAEVLRKEG